MTTPTQHSTALSQLTQERALEFLGQGYSQERVAQVIGVTSGAIAQLMAREDFREAVRARRTEALKKQTELDSAYDDIEMKLVKVLEKKLPLMALAKPRDVLDAIKVINGAKRRGAEVAPTTEPSKIVNINMPVHLLQQFTQVQKLENNQIIKAGSQDLLTLSPQALVTKARAEETPTVAHTEKVFNELTSLPEGNPGRVPEEDKESIPGKTRELRISDLD